MTITLPLLWVSGLISCAFIYSYIRGFYYISRFGITAPVFIGERFAFFSLIANIALILFCGLTVAYLVDLLQVSTTIWPGTLMAFPGSLFGFWLGRKLTTSILKIRKLRELGNLMSFEEWCGFHERTDSGSFVLPNLNLEQLDEWIERAKALRNSTPRNP